MTNPPPYLVVSALGIVEIFAWGSSYYLLTVLAPTIVQDTGWPLSWILGCLSCGLIVSGLLSPRVGRTIGRRGGQPVLGVALLVLSVGLLILSIAPSLPVFLLGWLVIGAGMSGTLYDAAFATLGRLYGSEARRSISTLTLWGGFASTVCWPLSFWGVAHLGWRGACAAYAILLLGIALPLVWILVPNVAPADGAGSAERDIHVGRLLSSERSSFCVLAAILMICGAVASIVAVNLLTILQARGANGAAAISLAALVGPSQVGARILELANRGKHHPIWTLTAAIGMIALGLLLLLINFPVVALSLIFYGAGNGVYSIARGTLPLALFGPERYAALVGRLALPNLFAQALGPFAAAVILANGGAHGLLSFLACLSLINVLLVSALWRLRFKAPFAVS